MTVQKALGFALFSAATACHTAAQGEATPAYVVEFPGGWTRAASGASKTVLSLPLAWDVRASPNGKAGEEWLVRVKAVDGAMSDECYALRRGTSRAVRREQADCARAPEVEPTVTVAPATASPGSQGVVYENRPYAMSGRVPGKTMLSATRRWLAVMSQTPSGDMPRLNPMPALGGGEPSKGELYVDLYDTATGVRRASARAPFAGFGARILFDQAFWVRDHLFVMPLNTLANQCFAIAPELQ